MLIGYMRVSSVDERQSVDLLGLPGLHSLLGGPGRLDRLLDGFVPVSDGGVPLPERGSGALVVAFSALVACLAISRDVRRRLSDQA